MSKKNQQDTQRLDEAARAGWLYYVAGLTQDEIARQLQVSRQTAQRLVALAVSEGLIKVRLEHPIARCMQLAHDIKQRFGLRFCEVVPSASDDPNSTDGLSQAGAAAIERELRNSDIKTLAFGTGRVLRACADELMTQRRPELNIVSLVGNIAHDGTATRYDVAVRIAEKIGGRHYPMPVPVVAQDQAQRQHWQAQPHVARVLTLADQADALFVGIGNLGPTSPLYVDGFIDDAELTQLEQAGACGEIVSWVYNQEGAKLDTPFNQRVTSAPLKAAENRSVVGIAAGEHKVAAIRGALRSKIINALITNEYTASQILNS